MSDTTDPTVEYATPAPLERRRLVARAGGEYRLKRIGLALLLGGYGVWSLYDGLVKMPADNAAARRLHPGIEKLPHPAWDIPFNIAFGCCLPPLAVLLAGWSLYASRGEIVLGEDDHLTVPGHPPVPLGNVTAVDRGRWDRKGIALVDYTLDDGTPGTLRLDDFIYQRAPIDAIFDRVLAAVETPAAAADVPDAARPL